MQAWQASLSQGQLHGLTNGQNGPVILGLHGYLDNAESLSCLSPFFDGYQFIAIDLPGHGKSFHRPRGAHYHQLDYIQDIHELIVANHWHKVILVGHSLGGILASLYAAVFPDFVAKVVSIDACGPLIRDVESSAQQVRESIESRLAKAVLPSKSREVDLHAAVASRCKANDIRPEHATAILSRNLKLNEQGLTVWGSDPRLRTKSSLRLTEAQAQHLMQSITCPVWFGGATNSFKTLETVYRKRQHWWKHSELALFSGGHHFHMEIPEETGSAIRRFVDKV